MIPYLEIYLSGADFMGSVFTGHLHSTGELSVGGDPWWPFGNAASVEERLSDGTQLVVAGDIPARRTGATISGAGGALIHSAAGRCAIDTFEMVFSDEPIDPEA